MRMCLPQLCNPCPRSLRAPPRCGSPGWWMAWWRLRTAACGRCCRPAWRCDGTIPPSTAGATPPCLTVRPCIRCFIFYAAGRMHAAQALRALAMSPFPPLSLTSALQPHLPSTEHSPAGGRGRRGRCGRSDGAHAAAAASRSGPAATHPCRAAAGCCPAAAAAGRPSSGRGSAPGQPYRPCQPAAAATARGGVAAAHRAASLRRPDGCAGPAVVQRSPGRRQLRQPVCLLPRPRLMPAGAAGSPGCRIACT